MKPRAPRPLRLETLEPRLPNDASDVEQPLPQELRTLIGEAVRLSLAETNWREPASGEAVVASMQNASKHLSLRGAQGLVRGIHASVVPAGPATQVTARIFRGNDEIAVVPVPQGGAFSYESDAGFTDVVFTPSVFEAMTVTTTELSVQARMAPASTDTLNNFSSKAFAMSGAPTVTMPTNVSAAVQYLKLTGSPNGSGEKRFWAERDPNQYTLFRIVYSKGGGRIATVGTISKTGVDYMGRETVATSGFPGGYMQQINDSTVLIAPGAPRLISFIGGFTNAVGQLTKVEGPTPESVLPPSLMTPDTVDVSLLKMYAQHREEGVFPGVTEIREGESPVFSEPGHIANVSYHVRNDALTGGPLQFDVYVGWYADAPTRGTFQKRFDTVMPGGRTILLSANVTAPPKPADATSDRPIISIVTRFKDGKTEIGSKLGKVPRHNPEYSPADRARLADVQRRAVDALMASSDPRLVAAREALGRQGVEAIAQRTYEQAVDAIMADTDQDPANDQPKATDAGDDEYGGILERIGTSLTPEEFMDRYLTAEGKFRFLHLLRTERELLDLGVDVAAVGGFTGNFDAMFEGMFGRAKMKIEPIDLKPNVLIPSDTLIKPGKGTLDQLVESMIPKITEENPWMRIEADVNRLIAGDVDRALAEDVLQLSLELKRQFTIMKRTAIWAATQAYKGAEIGVDQIVPETVRNLTQVMINRLKTIVPIIRAHGAADNSLKQAILIGSGIMEHHYGSPENAGKLIVLVNGHMQGMNDDPEENGMEYVQGHLPDHEVIQFRVGLAYEPLLHNPFLIKQLTQEVLFERLGNRGIFTDAPVVTSISLGGYSWGGGTAIDFARALEENPTYTSIPVRLGVLDAVQVGYSGLVQPAMSVPKVEALFNRYEENNQFTVEDAALDVLLGFTPISGRDIFDQLHLLRDTGAPAHGSELLGTHMIPYLDEEQVLNATHLNIDNIGTIDPTDPLEERTVIDTLLSFLKDQ